MRRIVRMSFNAEDVSTFLVLFENNKRRIAAFPGCKQVELLKDKQDLCVFFTYSIWESAEALAAYRESELFKTVWAETKKCFNAPPTAWSMDLEWTSGL